MSSSKDIPGPIQEQLDWSWQQQDSEAAARGWHDAIRTRRSVRHFSTRNVSAETIRQLVAAASTAPSGAKKQPWKFVAISNPELKREIRLAAEQEEQAFYETRASETWKQDLLPLGTDPHKPFLEEAPWLIIIFKLMKDDRGEPFSDKVYYVNESVGIATGFFLAAAHAAGLATLTHTPNPMRFLQKILNRSEHERPYMIIPVGYPAEKCLVPKIRKKPLNEVMDLFE
ncbi:MAG: hypothetical protein CMJ32_10035 [Phycisphaerae bacterium]|nr:hypothetical protein [Phycisphaerae bacterium]